MIGIKEREGCDEVKLVIKEFLRRNPECSSSHCVATSGKADIKPKVPKAGLPVPSSSNGSLVQLFGLAAILAVPAPTVPEVVAPPAADLLPAKPSVPQVLAEMAAIERAMKSIGDAILGVRSSPWYKRVVKRLLKWFDYILASAYAGARAAEKVSKRGREALETCVTCASELEPSIRPLCNYKGERK